MRIHLGSILAISLLIGCSSRGSPTHSFNVYSENGIIVAESSGGPKYTEELFEYEAYLHLQQDETLPESLFSRPFGFSMDSDGWYYILDGAEDRIVVFSPDGQFSHSIGRSGNGPGEFQGPRYLSVYQENVSVYDGSLRRVSRFDRMGTFISSKSLSNQPFSTLTAHVGPRDELICIVRRLVMEPQDADPYTVLTANIFSSDGDSIAAIDTPKMLNGNPQADYAPGLGIYVIGGNDPWIKWFNLEGALTRIVRISETQHVGGEPDQPWWGLVQVEEDGKIWARIPSELGYQDPDSHIYRLLSSEGEYLGDTKCPKMPWYFMNGFVLAFEDYPSDISPVVYRLKPAVQGFRFK